MSGEGDNADRALLFLNIRPFHNAEDSRSRRIIVPFSTLTYSCPNVQRCSRYPNRRSPALDQDILLPRWHILNEFRGNLNLFADFNFHHCFISLALK